MGDTGRNFDDLVAQFNGRIYQTSKGRIRLAILARDLAESIPALYQNRDWQILDAGGGEGVYARVLAHQGHHITLCDQSQQMISNAQTAAVNAGLSDRFRFFHCPIQQLDKPLQAYDLIMCHAVLEWVSDPRSLLQTLQSWLTPGGYLSLMFFNRHSTVFRCLVRGYLDKAKNDQFEGSGKGLTPLNPLLPDQVLGWLQSMGFKVLVHSGIRVFHDYMHFDIRQNRSEADITELELRYSRMEPYRSLGRYIHVVVQAPN